jgi:hypothetical protein
VEGPDVAAHVDENTPELGSPQGSTGDDGSYRSSSSAFTLPFVAAMAVVADAGGPGLGGWLSTGCY